MRGAFAFGPSGPTPPGMITRRQLGRSLLGATLVPGFGTSACQRGRAAPEAQIGISQRTVLPAEQAPPPPAPPPASGSEAEKRDAAQLLARRSHRSDGAMVAAARAWSAGVALRWNEAARELVARHRVDLLAASRLYALLSVAQHDAAWFAEREQRRWRRPPPASYVPGLAPPDPTPLAHAYPSVDAAIAAASRAVLVHFFPSERALFDRRIAELAELRVTSGVAAPSDLAAGELLGAHVGTRAVAYGESDGANATAAPSPADKTEKVDDKTEAGRWIPAAGREPLGQTWGRVRPWIIGEVSRFRAPPPPPVGTPAFTAALAEVRRLSETRTREQRRIAALWADGLGSYSPAGRWNKIAADLIRAARVSEVQAVRALALLNMALMDAGIACWDTKFHYWLWRPYHADNSISTPVGKPEFPSYTSAHASFSGAAAGVLGALFPDQRLFLEAKAQEAAISRMYAGIHFGFDADAGLAQGRAVARATLAWGRQGAV